MLAVTVMALWLLALATWRIGRSTLFPPLLYCAIWASTLGGIGVAGARFLSISEYACLIYLVGAVSFALGGVICLSCFDFAISTRERLSWRTPRTSLVALDLLLVLLILIYPYFLHLAVTLAGTSNPLALLVYIRRLTVEKQGGSPFGAIANLTVLAPLVALAITYESDGSFARRARSVVAIIVALAYGVLTGSKGGALLLVTVFFVTQIRARRISVKTGIAAVTLFLFFFGVGLIAINFGGSTRGNAGGIVRQVGGEVLNYWLGSPIAFSKVVERPDSLPSSESIDRFFLQTENSFGMRNKIPSINPPYTTIEAGGKNTNTYTIYFSYFKDFGWIGATLLLAAVGAMVTWVWRWAMVGGPIAALLYANLCTAILQSIYSENFFVALNFYIKAITFYIALYRIIPAIAASVTSTGRDVAEHHQLI